MRYGTMFVFLFTVSMALAGEWSFLDPSPSAGFPNAMVCDTGLTAAHYKRHFTGQEFYRVKATPIITSTPIIRCKSPVIDGFLEPDIWQYSDTLIINSAEDAGQKASCQEQRFYGPQDMHAIWRFMYNQDSLYIGCEVHDDIVDVDSLKGWAGQDGVELIIEPSDWGESARWLEDLPFYRMYFSSNRAIVPQPGNAHLCYVKLLKRLNTEKYMAGLIRGIHKAYYNKGDEVNNYTLGNADMHGINFAADYQGVDPWGRKVWHLEFAFPLHNELWKELGSGFFRTDGSRMPKLNMFKMDFMNNDDDILGADGARPNFTQMGRRHEDSPCWPTQNWSDNKFYMVMQYVSPNEDNLRVVAPPFSDKGRTHGDAKISGVTWVSAVDTSDHTDYPFTGEGTVIINGSYYFFDSIPGTLGGALSTLSNGLAGHYTLKPHPNHEMLLDTLRVSLPSSGTDLVLQRKLLTGYNQVEGRWVEARLVTQDNPGCAIRDSVMVPTSDTAREYRFSPLSRIFPPTGMADSVRIYRYKTSAFLAGYTYTATKAISGRTKTHFTYEVMPRRIIRAGVVGGVNNIIVRWLNSSGAVTETDTLVEIKPYNLLKFGETGTPFEGGQSLNKTNNLISTSSHDTAAPSVWRIKMEKYPDANNPFGILQLFMGDSGSTVNRLRVNLYDSVMLAWDSLKPNYWKTVFLCSVKQDSFELAGYDSTTGKADSLRPKQDRFFPNDSWVQQCCTLIVRDTLRTGADTFVFKDTTRVWHWDYYFWVAPSGAGARRNLIDTATCPYLYPGITVEKSAGDALVMTVRNDPNPFNPTTLVRFVIPGQKREVRYALHIYDVRGSLIRTLVKGMAGTTGIQKRVLWDGTDNRGRSVSAGIYYYRLSAGSQVRQGSMVMVK